MDSTSTRNSQEASSQSAIELIELLAQQKSQVAWEQLVERFGPDVARACGMVLRDPEQAADAWQDSMMLLRDRARAFKARQGDSDDAVRRWLVRLAVNCALSHARREQRHRRRRQESDMLKDRPDQEPTPVEHLLAAEVHGHLADCLAQLSERDRGIIVLRYFLHHDQHQLAQALGCKSPATARSRLHRALSALRTRFTTVGCIVSLASLDSALSHLSASTTSIAACSTCTPSELFLSQSQLTDVPTITPLHQGGILMTIAKSLVLSACILGAITYANHLSAATTDTAEPAAAAPAAKDLDNLIADYRTGHAEAIKAKTSYQAVVKKLYTSPAFQSLQQQFKKDMKAFKDQSHGGHVDKVAYKKIYDDYRKQSKQLQEQDKSFVSERAKYQACYHKLKTIYKNIAAIDASYKHSESLNLYHGKKLIVGTKERRQKHSRKVQKQCQGCQPEGI